MADEEEDPNVSERLCHSLCPHSLGLPGGGRLNLAFRRESSRESGGPAVFASDLPYSWDRQDGKEEWEGGFPLIWVCQTLRRHQEGYGEIRANTAGPGAQLLTKLVRNGGRNDVKPGSFKYKLIFL